MLDPDYSFSCPHCGAGLTIVLDRSGGSRQRFVQDCETCCKPIQIEVRFEGEEISEFSAEPAE